MRRVVTAGLINYSMEYIFTSYPGTYGDKNELTFSVCYRYRYKVYNTRPHTGSPCFYRAYTMDFEKEKKKMKSNFYA